MSEICPNCGHGIANDLKHVPDPYEKGVCQTIDIDTSAFRGWTRHKDTVKNVDGKNDAPEK